VSDKRTPSIGLPPASHSAAPAYDDSDEITGVDNVPPMDSGPTLIAPQDSPVPEPKAGATTAPRATGKVPPPRPAPPPPPPKRDPNSGSAKLPRGGDPAPTSGSVTLPHATGPGGDDPPTAPANLPISEKPTLMPGQHYAAPAAQPPANPPSSERPTITPGQHYAAPAAQPPANPPSSERPTITPGQHFAPPSAGYGPPPPATAPPPGFSPPDARTAQAPNPDAVTREAFASAPTVVPGYGGGAPMSNLSDTAKSKSYNLPPRRIPRALVIGIAAVIAGLGIAIVFWAF
jgi:hypothetical protein